MDAAPDSWFQELSIRFSDGTVQVLHIERRDTGTHTPRSREKPQPWVMLPFNKCSSCTLPEGIRCCPAAQSLQVTMGKLRQRSSVERVKATAVDGEGRSQSVESDLQSVGSTLVRFAVFETTCPVGYRLKPYVAGLPAFASSLELMRHVTRKILERHGGAVEAARKELAEVLGPLQEVFLRLVERIRGAGQGAHTEGQAEEGEPFNDAVPNSIVAADAIAKCFAMKADRLCAEVSSELGWIDRRREGRMEQPTPVVSEHRRRNTMRYLLIFGILTGTTLFIGRYFKPQIAAIIQGVLNNQPNCSEYEPC